MSLKLSTAPGLLGSISQTAAVGLNATGNKSFNDLIDYGNFPVEQNIERIIKIELWAGDRVFGIKPTYVLAGGSHVSKLHGIETSNKDYYSFDLDDHQWIVGVFGRKDKKGYVGRLSFVVFEADNGRAVIKESDKAYPPNPDISFGTFGQIIAFAGTESNSEGLTSLSLVKDSNQGGPVVLA